MNWADKYTGFITAAYGLSAIVILALVVIILLRDRSVKKRLAALEGSRA